MNLHVDTQGAGEPLLFIHGWGMHGGMWGGVLERLAQHYRVLAVDLPGHGFSGKGEGFAPAVLKGEGGAVLPFSLPSSPFSLDAIVEQLATQFSDAASLTICGWSLGGQVALRWAQLHTEQVKKLVLVSSTPCFVQREGWACAMAASTLAAFSDALQQNYLQTLRRFLSLQLRGSEQERELLAVLRGELLCRGEPDLVALQAGLTILRDCDLRAALPEVRQSVLVMAGVRDTLTPLRASEYLAEQLPDARLVAIKGAAHAPFLSHPDEFVDQLVGFLHE